MSIWLVLSSIIRQIVNGIDNETDQQGANNTIKDEGLDASAIDNQPYEPIVQVIKIGIAAFSVILLGLSLSAYKKTALKSIICAAIAFGLFALQLFLDYLGDVMKSFDQHYNDVIFYAMTLAILLLFFIAIVRRK